MAMGTEPRSPAPPGKKQIPLPGTGSTLAARRVLL